MSKNNFDVYMTGKNKIIKAWTRGVHFDENSLTQIGNIARMPFVFKHVAVMPDVHLGKGAAVGSVIATQGAIMPSTPGVDLGCGMIAVQTDLTASDMPDDMKPVRQAIERAVPHGRTNHGGPGDRGAWGNVSRASTDIWVNDFNTPYQHLVEKYPKIESRNTLRHMGTLGGGNHFVEICLDKLDNVWIMLHSGSRGMGNKIGTFFIDMALKECQRHYITLDDPDLAYLVEGDELFSDYIGAVDLAQDYARINRDIMMANTIKALGSVLKPFSLVNEAINCHHNYVAKESHYGQNVLVTRKGAVRARKGDLGIIPGSMGAKSFIVRGLGNKDSYCSCSHGAGRVMSRTKAKEHFSLEDHIKATDGVECRKDKAVIDETPGAYKDIDAVMAAQSDLVEIVAELKQIVCVKG